MKCRNIHCYGTAFVAVIEMDNNQVIGLKCCNCGARYSLDKDIEIKPTLKREGWNSVKWCLK